MLFFSIGCPAVEPDRMPVAKPCEQNLQTPSHGRCRFVLSPIGEPSGNGRWGIEVFDESGKLLAATDFVDRSGELKAEPPEIRGMRVDGAILGILYRIDVGRLVPIRPVVRGTFYEYHYAVFHNDPSAFLEPKGWRVFPADWTGGKARFRQIGHLDCDVFKTDPAFMPEEVAGLRLWEVRLESPLKVSGTRLAPDGGAERRVLEFTLEGAILDGKVIEKSLEFGGRFIYKPEAARKHISDALTIPWEQLDLTLRTARFFLDRFGGDVEAMMTFVRAHVDTDAQAMTFKEKFLRQHATEMESLRAWEAGAPERERALAERLKKEEEERLLRIKAREDAVRKIEQEKARKGLIAIEKVLMEMSEIEEEDQEGGDPRIDAEERRRKELEIKEMLRKMFGENKAEMAE
jgi:hypothetical protein